MVSAEVKRYGEHLPALLKWALIFLYDVVKVVFGVEVGGVGHPCLVVELFGEEVAGVYVAFGVDDGERSVLVLVIRRGRDFAASGSAGHA